MANADSGPEEELDAPPNARSNRLHHYLAPGLHCQPEPVAQPDDPESPAKRHLSRTSGSQVCRRRQCSPWVQGGYGRRELCLMIKSVPITMLRGGASGLWMRSTSMRAASVPNR